MREDRRITLIPPIGKLPSPCPELRRRIDGLPDDSTIADVFRVISKWENWATKEARKREKTKKSGLLNVICAPIRMPKETEG